MATRSGPIPASLALAFLLGVAGCGAAGAKDAKPAKTPSREAPMSASVNELLARLTAHPDLTVEVTTGLEHWRKGLVTLSARGDGTAEVINRAAGKETRKAGKAAPDALMALGAACAAAGIPTLKSPPGPREPGDTPVVLRVLQAGQVLAQADVWYADRYDNAALDRVIEAYDGIVSDLTGGELPY